MKQNNTFITFIIVYYLCFVLLTIGTVDIVGGSQHAETLSGIIYGDLFYIVFGALSWFLIDLLASTGSVKNDNIIKFFLGLIILNLFVLIAANFIPLLTLLTADIKSPHFGTSVFILGVYIVSFIVATVASKKIMQEISEDQ